jgi:cysteinyl-tRNA synthetase
MLKLYNSLTREKEDFKPINEDGIVRMYSCGPTVYYYAHIGNLRSYIFMDELRRTLHYNNYKIKGVMNITDVGHLTSDADSGEDKMEKSAKAQNESVYEIAKKYTDYFVNDLNRLNIGLPEYMPKATDNIDEMIKIVKGLEDKGYTYKTSDGIYFDTSKFADYGKLSRMKIEDKKAGARVEFNEEKKNISDFALWKYVEPNHIMKWDSPWGVGCPGWHIECSAMGMKYLGEHIDIHTGGVDHLPVHHENEIAQNNCYTGHKVVERWMHGEFLQVDGGKMSKSLHNVYTIQDLIDKGYSPLDFRYFCLGTHYRKKLNFTFDGLDASKVALVHLKDLVNLAKSNSEILNDENKQKLQKFDEDFTNSINDDLNVPLGLGILWDMLKTLPKNIEVYNEALKMDKIMGLDLDKEDKKEVLIPDEVKDLANQRLEARKNKNFALADELRTKVSSLGYSIKDTATGYDLIKD